MRKIYYLPLALAALSLGSCSSDDATAEGGKSINFAEGGYVRMSINMPTKAANAVRSDNDIFNDGLASEYAVKDASLILFQGNDEGSATFHSAYDITPSMEMLPDDPNQITSVTKIVKKVSNDENLLGNNLYALVVLNRNNVINVNADNSLTVNGAAFTGTFADLQAVTVTGNAPTFNTSGFFMTNAPLASMEGGANADADPTNATVNTLVKVNDKVFATAAEAHANPAASIYVERAVGKVTMSSAGHQEGNLSGEDMSQDGVNNEAALKYVVDGWKLDITNNKSYIVHNYSTVWNGLNSQYLDDAPNYRFIGGTPVEKTVALWRTYWGTDPNYSTAAAGDFALLASDLSGVNFNTAFDGTTPEYCMENTFDVDNMNQDVTTRVVVRVKLNDGNDFYVINGDHSTLWTVDGVSKRVKQAALNNQTIIDAIANANLGTGVNVGEDDVTYTFGDRNATDGSVKVASITVTKGQWTYEATADVVAAVNQDIKTITKYVNGYSYYPVRIKHFGDELTPWNSTQTGVTPGTSYPANSDAAYLGRYGVLRNNWYDLSVTGIKAIGSATVPERPSTDDDEFFNYMSVKINVLSWAKRSQQAEL